MQVPAISGRCGLQHLGEIESPFPVQINSSDRFNAKDRPEIHGRIGLDHGQMIQALLKEEALKLHVLCTVDADLTSLRRTRSYGQIPCTLEITVYGPLELFEEIGSWFQEYEIYLQDPGLCHLDVKYCNPQKLSSDDLDSSPMVSEVISRASEVAQLQDITGRPELLDILTSHAELEETPQPLVVRTALQR